MAKISKKFRKMVPLYVHFSKECGELDYSDEMMYEMYVYESKGGVAPQKTNGYFWGKKMLNLAVAMWKEDLIKGTLFLFELYEDANYPHWWLNKVFKRTCRPKRLDKEDI